MKQAIHNFDVSLKEARSIQENLRNSLVQKALPKNIKYIAGVDVSFNKFEKDVYAGIIVLSYPDLAVVEYQVAKMEVNFPYIPGFLSFREIPPLIKCWEKLKTKPDVVVVDGHGIAHPRRLGIAAHFGLVIQTPTIGAAKKILYGTFRDPSFLAGVHTFIKDPKTGETIGAVVRTKNNVKPMFVSPGNLCTIDDSVRIILACTRGYRLPEQTRMAHNLVNAFRKGEIEPVE
jgi:deoxyribonuclease V